MSDPISIAIITGSFPQSSKSAALALRIAERLRREGFRSRILHVRDLPPVELLHSQTDAHEIATALALIEKADGVVVLSPVVKAAYSGLLKAFLDLLPQRALEGKVVLPLLTGSSLIHVLAVDYALRPVLQALEPRHVVPGLFLLEQAIDVADAGHAELDPESAPHLETVVRAFVEGVRSAAEA